MYFVFIGRISDDLPLSGFYVLHRTNDDVPLSGFYVPRIHKFPDRELRRCVKVELDVQGSPSLLFRTGLCGRKAT